MTIKLDFYKDISDQFKCLMKKHWGIETDERDHLEIFYQFYSLYMRKVSIKKRKLFISKEFSTKNPSISGLDLFFSKITSGEDLNPHLSLRSSKINKLDDMLLDWNIYHFHLGNNTHSKNKNFVERTGDLLFATVRDDAVYVIDIGRHNSWADQHYIEIIHNNWPKIISNYVLDADINISEISEDERISLRKSGNIIFTKMKDGTVYISPGGGRSISGKWFPAEGKSQYLFLILKKIEEETRLNIIYETLNQNISKNNEKKPDVTAVFNGNSIFVISKKYKYRAEFEINPTLVLDKDLDSNFSPDHLLKLKRIIENYNKNT